MAWNVYPTDTPVGIWQGKDCRYITEYMHAELFNRLHQSPLHSFRCSGGVFTKGSGDSLDIPTGIYIIDGRAVENDAAENLVITATRPTYLFARLLKTGSLVTSAEYYANTTGTLPSEPHVIIGMISAGDVIEVSQAYPNVCTGNFTGIGGTKEIFLGFEPKRVELTLLKGIGNNPWYSVGITGSIGLTTDTIDVGGSYAYVLTPSNSNTFRPILNTFSFTAPATFNESGKTIYWTAWA